MNLAPLLGASGVPPCSGQTYTCSKPTSRRIWIGDSAPASRAPGDLRGLPHGTGALFFERVDEDVMYADKLRAAGVPVDLEIYRGVTHEFIKMGRIIPEARQAHLDAAKALRQAFG